MDIYGVLMLRSFTQKIKAGEDIDCEIESGPRSFKRPAGYMTLYTNWNQKSTKKNLNPGKIFFLREIELHSCISRVFFSSFFLHIFIRNDPR